jgi:hypothetical protein
VKTSQLVINIRFFDIKELSQGSRRQGVGEQDNGADNVPKIEAKLVLLVTCGTRILDKRPDAQRMCQCSLAFAASVAVPNFPR